MDAGEKFLQIIGLEDILIGSRVEAGDGRICGGFAGEHNNGFVCVRFDFAAEVEAIALHVSQIIVNDEKIRS